LLTKKETKRLLSTSISQVLASRYFLFLPERLRFLTPIEDRMRAMPFGGQYAVFAQRC